MKTAPILHYFPLPLYLCMLIIFAFVSVSNMLVLLLLDFSSSKHFSLIPLGEGEDLAFFFPTLSHSLCLYPYPPFSVFALRLCKL